MPDSLIALFPLIDMGEITYGTMRLAGPKAITAQTFKAKESEVLFFESGYWAKYSDLFAAQANLLSPPPAVEVEESGPWVAYPYAVHPGYPNRTCAVWIETTPKRSHVRHVRLYRDTESALADNQIIRDVIMH